MELLYVRRALQFDILSLQRCALQQEQRHYCRHAREQIDLFLFLQFLTFFVKLSSQSGSYNTIFSIIPLIRFHLKQNQISARC